MSLSTALEISRSSLAATSELTRVASRNIAHIGNANATRKIAGLVTDPAGGARIGQINRAADALRDGLTGATSDNARLDVIVTALDRLDLTSGQSSAVSPASRLSALQAALQTFSANPADQTSAAAVVSAASGFVSTLGSWSQNALAVRQQADADITAAVIDINTKLAQFHDLNAAIVNGTIAGTDFTDLLDARDSLVTDIAQQIGVTRVDRANNSIALYTDSGISLFDGRPRAVTVQSAPFAEGMPGGSILVDGVPAIGQNSAMPISSGRLVGLVQVRDEIAITFGAQLDDIATSAIRAFRETDQGTPAALPDAMGLFTSALMTSVPPAGSSNPGLARTIAVNANVDPTHGGDLMRLRDGAISNPTDPAYSYNATGSSGFNDRVRQLISALDSSEPHDPATNLPAPVSITDFSANALGWLQRERYTASRDLTYADTLLQRAHDARSREGGISIDDEMATLLSLERTYQASAKLLATVDNMLGTLFQAIG